MKTLEAHVPMSTICSSRRGLCPNRAHVHSAMQAMFSHVDGAEALRVCAHAPRRGDCRRTSGTSGKSWARISACPSSYARWHQWPSGWPSGQQGLQLAPPQSSAESPPTQVIVAHHSLAHWSTKLLKPLCQFNVAMSAMEVIPGISRWVLGVIKRRNTL